MLRTSGIIIGRTELERLDPARRIASGELRPALGWELVEPVFALAASRGVDAAARFARARDALGLTLAEEPAGTPVPCSDVRISSAGQGGGPVVELVIDDPAFWSRRGA